MILALRRSLVASIPRLHVRKMTSVPDAVQRPGDSDSTRPHANAFTGGWNEVLQHLSSLITFKTRADGKNWRDAFENMPVYIEVRLKYPCHTCCNSNGVVPATYSHMILAPAASTMDNEHYQTNTSTWHVATSNLAALVSECTGTRDGHELTLSYPNVMRAGHVC